MKTRIFAAIFLLFLSSFAFGEENVSPDLKEIHIIFNVPMKTDSWSFVEAGTGVIPEVTGDPYFKDEYTCVLPVKLKPATSYSIGINSKNRKGFVSKNGVPAEPFVLIFRTSDKKSEKKAIIYDFYFDTTQRIWNFRRF